MKNLFTLLLCTLLAHQIYAQTFPYTLTVDQGVYFPLTNGISVNNGQTWDDEEENVPLGFGFQFFGQTTEILHLFGGATAYNVFGAPATETPLIISYGADLVDRGFESGVSQSPVSFNTIGFPGSRVFKMEWANAGFFGSNSETDFINLQLWIREGSNDVELHFGPVMSTAEDNFDFTGPLIGFMNNYNFSTDDFQDMWYLRGPVVDPEIAHISTLDQSDTLFHTLNGTPFNGLIYRFSTGVSAVGDPAQADQGIRVYPSLVNDAMSIAVNDETAACDQEIRYAVLDPLGKTVRSGQVNSQLERVEMSGLPGGLYYVHLFSPERTLATKKITKLR